MRTLMAFGVVSIAALSGCASVTEGIASMQPPSTGELSSVDVGPARLLDARVNPAAGVRIAADGDALVVHFAHLRGLGEVERLDPTSLQPISQAAEAIERTSSELVEAPRVALDGGRFIMLWKSGDAERGYRAMAQAFNADDGTPRGPAVAISPFDADVTGPLGAATSDGHHVVATFAASTQRSFGAYAVPLEAL